MTYITIRPAVAADSDLLGRIAREAYAKYGSRMNPLPAPVFYDYLAIAEEGHSWIISDRGTACAMVTLIPCTGYLLLRNLAVFPNCQGRGLGRTALLFAEAEARSRRLSEIRLWTNIHMPENLPFYFSAGYVETHRGESNGYSFIYMSKPVSWEDESCCGLRAIT